MKTNTPETWKEGKMPKKQGITLADLKSLLVARFKAEQTKRYELSARIAQELGDEVREEKPEDVSIMNKFIDLISSTIARRLKKNQRTIPLLSPQDLTKITPLMIAEITKNNSDEFEAEDYKKFEKIMETVFKNISTMVNQQPVPPHKDLYERYWHWVTIVLNLATEYRVQPIELLSSENATDEITRRMFTKQQFVFLSEQSLEKLMDCDALKKAFIQPLLDMLTNDLTDEERREIEKDFEAEDMPELRQYVEKARLVAKAILNEEIMRIYEAV